MRQPARSDEVWIYHKVMQMYKDVRGGRDVGFLQSRNCAVPLQFWNYNKFWTRANAVRPYRFVAIGFVFQSFFYLIFKLRSGCVTEYNALGFAYTKYQMHAHVLTQVLYSLLQKLPSVSPSHRACTCPQVSKRFLLIHEKGVFCCIKNATIAEMLPN